MKHRRKVRIIKASGEEEVFDPKKLMRSLARAGATPDTVQRVVQAIQPHIHEGMSTALLYNMAFGLLRKEGRPLAARYRIKKAIMELGPSGYPFEQFVGEILKAQGYRVRIGVIVQGHCISHEIDVEAEKEDQYILVECKYHNQQGVKSDVKTALYVHARFQDIRQQWESVQANHLFREAWLVTNTKFSADAVRYGSCAGLHLMSWNYPAEGNLQEIITRLGLYPLTCLTTLNTSQKTLLLSQGVVLCKALQHNEELLRYIGLSEEKIASIMREVESFG